MKEFIGNQLIAKLKLRDKHYDVWDTKITGFILRVHPTGSLAYRVEFGRGKRVTIGKSRYMTPTQARDKAKEILSQAALGIDPNYKKKGPINLNTFLHMEYSSWRLAHRKNGKADLKRLEVNFTKKLGNVLLSDITPMSIEKWRTTRINKGINKATVNRDINVLKSALAKAVEWGFITEHPLKNLKLSRVDNAAKVRFLSTEEEKALFECLKERDCRIKEARCRGNIWRAKRKHTLLPDLKANIFADHLTPMIVVSLNTGLRQGELFDIKWSNINFKNSVLTISGSIAKSGKTRHIPLNTLALNVLSSWRSQKPNSDFVFTSDVTHGSFDNVRKAWAGILKKAKIHNFRWHDMRHHFASKLVMAGVDLNTVRELLGHSDIKMTLRYAHLAPEHKAHAVEKIVVNF